MTDTQYSSAFIPSQTETTRRVTWGSFVAAFILAAMLGLSAVDINRQSAATADSSPSVELDGRGKWGGYL